MIAARAGARAGRCICLPGHPYSPQPAPQGATHKPDATPPTPRRLAALRSCTPLAAAPPATAGWRLRVPWHTAAPIPPRWPTPLDPLAQPNLPKHAPNTSFLRAAEPLVEQWYLASCEILLAVSVYHLLNTVTPPHTHSQLELVNQWHSGELQRLLASVIEGDVTVNLVRRPACTIGNARLQTAIVGRPSEFTSQMLSTSHVSQVTLVACVSVLLAAVASLLMSSSRAVYLLDFSIYKPPDR